MLGDIFLEGVAAKAGEMLGPVLLDEGEPLSIEDVLEYLRLEEGVLDGAEIMLADDGVPISDENCLVLAECALLEDWELFWFGEPVAADRELALRLGVLLLDWNSMGADSSMMSSSEKGKNVSAGLRATSGVSSRTP